MAKTALIIIFNHRFDRNLPILRTIYAGRFDEIRFLVPFYDGPDEDVIPVYRGSHEFQGFVWDGIEKLRNLQCDTYVFAGDDLILNPALDARALPHILGLGPEEGYIKEMVPLSEISYTWLHTLPAMEAFRDKAMNWQEFLPNSAAAFDSMRRHELRFSSLSAKILWPLRFRNRGDIRQLIYTIRHLLRGRSIRELPYPLVKAYADFFVVPGSRLETFAKYCGVFAAMKLHAEVATGVALGLSCPRLRTENDLAWKGCEIWNAQEREELETRYQKRLPELFASFPAQRLYIHPVKLSGWNLPASEEPLSEKPSFS